MIVTRGFKTELELNNQQRSYCDQHAGTARFAYNWGLARKQEAYRAGKKTPNAKDLHKGLNQLKQTELSWMYSVSKCAPQEALRNLDEAFSNFFRRLKEKKAGKRRGQVGYPRFKSKKRSKKSFRLTGTIRVFEKSIQLPRLGVLRLKERGYLPEESEDVHILSATVSEKAGRWFVSVQVEMKIEEPKKEERPVAGVDLGVNRMAQVSDGTAFKNPRALKKALKKIKRLQRIVSRRQQGSANHQRAVRKLAKAHYRVANIRKDALHQATTWLARAKSAVVLEDLNVIGMLKNHNLAQAIADVGMGEFKRQMEYKGKWYGCEVLFADRFYPSTKRCSRSGHVKKHMDPGERTYHCDECGMRMDRDLNAAINLEQLYFPDEKETTASSAGSNA
jgi:putative transposase